MCTPQTYRTQFRGEGKAPLTSGSRHYIAATVDYASDSNNIKIYVDGNLEGTYSHNFTNNAIPNTNSTNSTMGTDEDGEAPYFDGQVDEARIATVDRSADWIAAQFLSITDNFVSFSGDQVHDGVLTNDTDPDFEQLTATLVTGPSNAQFFALNSDGSFIYTPNADFNGVDSFTYQADDGTAQSNVATVTINVSAVNDDPTNAGSLPSDIAVTEDVASNVDLLAVAFSDVDAASGSLTVTLTTSTGGDLTGAAMAGITLGGTLEDLNTYFNTASNITYLHGTAHTNGDNADTIQVEINDSGNTGTGGGTDQNLGTVNVDITAVNDSPIGVPVITGIVEEDQTLTADTSGISDADGLGAFSYQWLRDGVSVGGANAVTYTLGDADVGALISVAVRYTDGHGTSEGPLTSAQTAAVTNVNDAPTAVTETYSTLQTDTLTISSMGVLANDSDIDGDPLSAVLVSSTAYGSLTLNADGSFNYIPTGTFAGTDSFTYVASDGLLSSNQIIVTIEIEPVSLAGGGTATDPPPDDPIEEDPIDEDPADEDPSEQDPIDEDPIAEDPVDDKPTPESAAEASPSGDNANGAIGPLSKSDAEDAVSQVLKITEEIATSDAAIMQLARTALRTSSLGFVTDLAQSPLLLPGFGEAVSSQPLSLFFQSENWAATNNDPNVSTVEIALGTTKVVTTAVTVGYVVWMVRGGSLFASMAASLPVWTTFDPLPILNSFEETNQSDEDNEDNLVDLVK